MRLPLVLAILLFSTGAAGTDFSDVRALLDSYQYAEACARLDEVAAHASDESETARLRGACMLGMGQLDRAKAQIEHSISIQPGNAEGHLLLARCTAAKAESAGLLSQLGLAREIRRQLEEAVRLDPELVAARVDLVRFHATSVELAGGNVEQADRQASVLETLDPAAAAFARGYIAYRRKKFAEAETAFQRSIAIEPSNVDSRIWAGYLFMETEQYTKAFETLEPLLELGYPPARFELGRTAAYSSSRLDEGELWLTSYLQEQPMQGWPSHARAWAFLGLLRERDRRPDEARAAWKRALRIDPDVEEANEGLRRLGR